ncbi:hypothetical protein ACFP1Z_07310 [Streptomyces gamaensis]|uniref:Uncharacterized protein n=1 Tax=Streptomyces gamaensis TaxID=1763542 RepID=A0ABW0YX25_9ACTN
MPEARTDTTEARPVEASAQAAAAGSGRHRGPLSPNDESGPSSHGKHRRTAE